MIKEEVKIVEVGPRDGLQNEKVILPIETKIELIDLLVDAGFKTIEPTSFVRPEYIPQMADSKTLFSSILKHEDIVFPALVPNKKGFLNSLDAGAKWIAIFTATSNTFNKKNTNATIDESLKRFDEFVPDATKEGQTVRGYISTVFGCPYEGETSIDEMLRLCERLISFGVNEISLGDTIGVANPSQVKVIIQRLKEHFDLSMMAMHFHDTEGMALANILASYQEGIRIFDSSVAGLGGCPYAKGASGNVASDDVINMFHKMNINTGIDQDKLHKASRFILKALGKEGSSKFFQANEGRKS